MTRPGRLAVQHSAAAEGPTFAERGAVADLHCDVAATRIQFCPKRIGFVKRDRVLGRIMRSEYIHRLTRREYTTAHVALLTRVVSRPKNFFEHLGPILYRPIIHLQNDMLNDCWSDAFIGEGKSNRTITAIELQDWPDRRAHLLSLHEGGITGNTHSQ